jgi:hypothetical protein
MQVIPMDLDLDLRQESSDVRREGGRPADRKAQLPSQG